MTGLVDTHCHLTLGELAADPDGCWEQARDAGVVQAVVVGIDAQSSARIAGYVDSRPGLFASVGVHPNHTAEADEEGWRTITGLLEHERVVALGETGFDRYRDRADADTQRRWFERHAELALERGLPVVLHLRDAFQEARDALAPFVRRGLRAVIHCFTGGPEDLEPFVDWGLMISFSGILTYPGAGALRRAAGRVPLELCLVETDAPWLSPVPERGRTNQPAFVVHTARRLAEVKDLSFEELARTTTRNARRFFGLPA